MYRPRHLVLVMFLNFSSASNSIKHCEQKLRIMSLTLKNSVSLAMYFIISSHLTCEKYCSSTFFPWMLEVK